MKKCIKCGTEYDISMISKKYLDKNPEIYNLCSYCRKYKKCLNCGEEFNHKQNQTCSKECSKELKEKSWLISCGSTHNFSKNSSSRKDWEDKLLENEGITNVFQREDVKEKSKITCLDKYGVNNYALTDECKNKIKLTSLEKYGVESSSQSEEIKNKVKQTNLKKYGVYSLLLLKDFREINMLNKYGTKYPSQLDFVKEKVKNTRNTKEFKDKMIEKGYYLDPQKLSEKELYYFLVDKETKKSLKEYGEKYFGKNWRNKIGCKDNHIDHIYSVIEGFNNKILPYIIGSIHNLRIIPFMENCIKQGKCDITLEELFYKISK